MYLLYRFEVKPSKEKLNYIRDKLVSIKSQNVDMDKHAPIFKEADKKEQVYIGTKAFYKEIDDAIGWEL